ncbi:hypothetical protein [Thermogutta sp.]|uniref:hypothetical protein n=1 Tax=Thermogutta sp. TaxID=1962930 RepID=UPI003C7B0674
MVPVLYRTWKNSLVASCLLVIVLFGRNRITQGGGGPENVLLVVNPNSPTSLAVANFYQSLRGIPDSNVLYLPWDPQEQVTDVDRFREKILLPIVEHLTRQGFLEWIDCVAYSADFPWGIELQKDIQRFAEEHPELLPPARPGRPSDGEKNSEESASSRWPRVLTPRGSLNGLTYLYAGVLARRPDYYMSLRVNQYMRRAIPEQKELPTLGFNSRLQFDEHGNLAKQGQRYLLSMVLAVAADEDTRGNTLEEIFEYLRRSAAADGSFPQGTIYFVQNDDIRSRTRDPAYPEVVEALQKLDVRAEIVHGIMPENKPDCQGVMMGTAEFDWARSGSIILPGAICDHLTSLGGVMAKSAGQTPLTEFLRYGAAAASGTVIEPFAIAEKFPLPTIHLHYARGCTTAEAFYQSVYGPYQLLIVGDPLCRPWANIPVVELQEFPEGKTVQGVLTLHPRAEFPRPGLPQPIGGGQVDHFEWFVDGRLVGRSGANEAFVLDTRPWDDGYHELRVVAVETGLIASRGELVVGLTSDNFGGQISVKLHTPQVRLGEPVRLHVESPGALAVVVRQNGRVLARKIGAQADFEIDSRKLGMGPVRLQAVGIGGPGRPKNTISRPISVIIERE